MHALSILQRCVAPLLIDIHRRRMAVLLGGVAATVSGPRLTLTEIGGRFGGGSALRHRIKRADRLLGNVVVQRDAKRIFAALARQLLAGVAEPLIVIDWSDLKADQSLHLLRASLPVGGRSLTLYEEVHTQRNTWATAESSIGSCSSSKRCCQPPRRRSSWRTPASRYRSIARSSAWAGAGSGGVRGRDYIKLTSRWRSCKRVFAAATGTPSALGIGEWVRSNPLRAAFVLVRQPHQGRRAKTASGRRARSKKSRQAARNARESLLLVASTRLAHWPVARMVKRQRATRRFLTRNDQATRRQGPTCTASSPFTEIPSISAPAPSARSAPSSRRV